MSKRPVFDPMDQISCDFCNRIDDRKGNKYVYVDDICVFPVGEYLSDCTKHYLFCPECFTEVLEKRRRRGQTFDLNHALKTLRKMG